MSTLAEASETLQDAAKDEKTGNKTVDTVDGKEEEDSETKDGTEAAQKDAVSATDGIGGDEATEAAASIGYHPIDVRL